nr:hypothetical protein GCM10020093_053430 [Planobispora longispora]
MVEGERLQPYGAAFESDGEGMFAVMRPTLGGSGPASRSTQGVFPGATRGVGGATSAMFTALQVLRALRGVKRIV